MNFDTTQQAGCSSIVPAVKPQKHLWGQRLQDLGEFLEAELGLDAKKARYHSRQIFKWVYQRKAPAVDQMTDLSKQLRARLQDSFLVTPPLQKVQEQVSSDGTRKYLFELRDGNTIESVLIPGAKDPTEEPSRLTICISSQVGCAMGCKFCLTASMGLLRNLTVEEIVGQVLELSKHAEITNIVFMGMGEPLHNLENVSRAVEILLAQDGLNFSKRKVTISTSGLVPAIRKLNERLVGENRVNLAISLNSSHDEQRESVMPVNKAFPIEELLQACRDFYLEPHRRITFEYVLMGDLNDTLEDAERVRRLLKGIPCKVNIIPYNPHPASPFKRPSEAAVVAFQKYLLDHDTAATVRHSRGRDILAACGQLKSANETAKAV
jgi:23S rRNA (adenine2503-C2)-methyltransferase